MQIIIVGCGNVGSTIVEKLSKEGHNITVIDTKSDAIKNVTINFDVMGMVGNGAGYTIQKEGVSWVLLLKGSMYRDSSVTSRDGVVA